MGLYIVWSVMGNYLQIFTEVYKFGYKLTRACKIENYQEPKLFGWGKRVRGPRPFAATRNVYLGFWRS